MALNAEKKSGDLLIIDSGFHEGWSTPMLRKFGREDAISLSPGQEALVINLLYLGTGLGSILTLFLMNSIGRKLTLLATAPPRIVAWLLYAVAPSVGYLYAGRFLAGVSNGVTYSVLPMYLAEMTSKQLRGLVGALISELINCGVLVIYAIGLSTERFAMSLIALCVPLIFSGSFAWCPESAFFLVRKNRLGKAENTLKWTLHQDDVGKELDEIRRIVTVEDAYSKITFKDICRSAVTKRENRRAWSIAFILLTAMTWTGATPLLAYQSFIYEQAGFKLSPKVSILMTGSLYFLFLWFSNRTFLKKTILQASS